MTETSTQDRLAALAARRAQSAPTAEPEPVAATVRSARLTKPSMTRVATTGTSLVSFVAMVVAMGPLTAEASQNDEPPEPVTGELSSSVVPTPTEVVIEVVPNYVHPDGTPLTPEELAFVTDPTSIDRTLAEPTVVGAVDAAGTPPPSAAATPGSTAATPGTTPSAGRTAAPPAPAPTPAGTATTAAPAAVAPAPAAAPAPAPAAPLPTAAPVTAPTTTAPPPTAAPTTAPATTPPPRSQASG